MINSKPENILKRKPTWEIVKLGVVCEIDPSKRELNGIDKTITVSFGMMADLSEHKRSFHPTEIKTINELAKGGYSYFKEGQHGRVANTRFRPSFGSSFRRESCWS